MHGFEDSGNSWQGPPVEFNAGTGFPCGSSVSGLEPATSGVTSGAQSAARRPSVTGGLPFVEFNAGTMDDKAGTQQQGSGDIAGDVSEVFMDELIGVPQANVDRHQTMYVHYDGIEAGQVSMTWKQQDAITAQLAQGGKVDAEREFRGLPLSCSLKIVQAPAAFARPMVQKKSFRPHFKLRLEMTYKGSLDFSVSMGAFPLGDSQYIKPGSLKPSAALNNQEVESFVVNKRVTSEDGGMDDSNMSGEERTMTEDFEFPDLKFIKSSRMTKRWLLFSFKIREDHIYCIFDLPSVIVSRKTDQFSKAYATLTGGPPPMKKTRVPGPSATASAGAGAAPAGRTSGAQSEKWGAGAPKTVAMMQVDTDTARNWIVSKYMEFLPNAMRRLSDHDVMWLLQKVQLSPTIREPKMIPGQKWEQFEEWYIKCLQTLQSVEATWDRVEPEIICGFYIDRQRAEQILQPQAPGTFLVRMCSEPGCFAVSSRTKSRDAFNHLLLDRVDLQRRRLPLWIQAHDAARQLINVNTGKTIPKEAVLMTGFYRLPKFTEAEPGCGTSYLNAPANDHIGMQGMNMGQQVMNVNASAPMHHHVHHHADAGMSPMMNNQHMFSMGQPTRSQGMHDMMGGGFHGGSGFDNHHGQSAQQQQMAGNLMDAPLSMTDVDGCGWGYDTDFVRPRPIGLTFHALSVN